MRISDASARILAGLLEARTGQQLTLSRRWRIETALATVMREHQIRSVDDLIVALSYGRQSHLADSVVDALLNNETYFFRDRMPFDMLRQEGLAQLAAARAATRRLNIWCAACSTGQEPYSLAMMFAEEPERWAGWQIDILGTDVSASVIQRARAGIYTPFEIQRGLGVNQMIRWFDERNQQWHADEQLRRRVRFSVHNLLDRPPGEGFDLILARNVLIYLCANRRAQVFSRLTSVLAPDGRVMLGAGETVIGQTDLLEADREMRGLYRHARPRPDALAGRSNAA